MPCCVMEGWPIGSSCIGMVCQRWWPTVNVLSHSRLPIAKAFIHEPNTDKQKECDWGLDCTVAESDCSRNVSKQCVHRLMYPWTRFTHAGCGGFSDDLLIALLCHHGPGHSWCWGSLVQGRTGTYRKERRHVFQHWMWGIMWARALWGLLTVRTLK